MDTKLTDAQKAEIKTQVEAQVQQVLASRGVGPKTFADLVKVDSDDGKVNRALAVFRGAGFENPNDADRFLDSEAREANRITYRQLVDALGTTESQIFIPRVLTTIVREATEPVIVLSTQVFKRLRVPAMTTVINFPSVGAIEAFDIAENQEYPSQKLDGAGYTIAKIGKTGVKVSLTEELIRYSGFDMMGLHVRAAGRAMARLKEVKAANILTTKGVQSFNNTTPSLGTHGNTTGRDINTLGNNTIILQDIFQMYADLVNRGFIPTDIICNPMGWLLFAREPSMRAWAFQNGGALFQAVTGQPGRGEPRETPNLGPSSGGGTTFGTINQASTQGQLVRALFPANIGMIVSPFVAFTNAAPDTTDIYLVDRDEVGVMVQDEDVVTERFDDPTRDVTNIKFRERYGLAVSNGGEGIASAIGVAIARGYDFESGARLTISPTGSPVLPTI